MFHEELHAHANVCRKFYASLIKFYVYADDGSFRLRKRLNISENSLNWMPDPPKEREFNLCQILDFDKSINECLAIFVLSFFSCFLLVYLGLEMQRTITN